MSGGRVTLVDRRCPPAPAPASNARDFRSFLLLLLRLRPAQTAIEHDSRRRWLELLPDEPDLNIHLKAHTDIDLLYIGAHASMAFMLSMAHEILVDLFK